MQPLTIHSLDARDLTKRLFWGFVAMHVVLWTLIAACTQPNQPLDMVEMLYWGRGWQWGYYKHPPLPAWIAAGVFQISAGHAWPLYLFTQLCVATTFYAAWKLAREFLAPWPALCASLLLDACANYNLITADLNHSLVLQPLWAVGVLCLYRATVTLQTRYWFGLGVCLGLGMLAKYDTAILALAMLGLPLVNRQARAALRGPGPYLTVAVSLLIFLPHLAWMVANHFPTIQYACMRASNGRAWLGHLLNPLEFGAAQALAHLPMLLVALPLWLRRSGQPLQRMPIGSLQRDFLALMCLGPFAIDLVISIITGMQLQSLWGVPMWSASGILLLRLLPTDSSLATYRAVARRAVLVGCVIALGVVGRNVALPHLRAMPSRVHFPGVQLAEAVEQQWQAHTGRPLTLVAGPWWTAANVGLHASGNVQVYDFINPQWSPWSNDTAMHEQGGVILWNLGEWDETYHEHLRRRFPLAEVLEPITVRWQTGAQIPPARFGVAIVPPRDLAMARREDRALRAVQATGEPSRDVTLIGSADASTEAVLR